MSLFRFLLSDKEDFARSGEHSRSSGCPYTFKATPLDLGGVQQARVDRLVDFLCVDVFLKTK